MPLSASDVIRLSQLLDEALPLDAAGREAWLANLPPEHQDFAVALRKALLTENGQVPELESLDDVPRIGPRVDAPATSLSGLKADDRVGDYRVIRELGAGGMAEVWLAERADGSFQREVALKLPRQIWQRRDLAQRFTRERNILAGLEHPHIGRLYDAGFTDAGLPYLAMEYVPGIPLTDWCDEQELVVRERLKLFLQVLDAVHYAHQHQVIHRDIKPSNILVTEAGQVKLLDFGIAKLLTQGDEQKTQITEIYGQALTPNYASPELLKGDELNAQSDIYSLGVLLFELLTGKRPYEVKAKASIVLLEQAIVATVITPPSRQVKADTAPARATSPERLARQLRGDLDAIVLKALAKSSADRYKSASGFAEDIQRHLAGEPIEARPSHRYYHFGKLIQRHRSVTAAVSGAAAVAFLAVGYVLIRAPSVDSRTISQNLVTGPVAVSDKSIAVLPFVDMSEKKDQEYFADGLSEELIGLLAKVPGLHVPARTSSFYFKGKATKLADIAKELSVANILEGSVRKSGKQLRIAVQLIRADSGDHLWSETYERKLDDIFKIQDDIAGEVIKALKVSLISGSMPKAKGTESTEAYSLYLQALSTFRRGTQADVEKSIDYLQRALQLDPKFAPAWAQLAYVHAWLFGFLSTGPYEVARADAYAAADRALRLDPQLSDAHFAKGYILIALDWNWDAALVEFRKAIAGNPANARALRGAATIMTHTQGRFTEGLQLALAAIESDPLDPLNYGTLGNIQYSRGNLAEAGSAHRKAIELSPSSAYWHYALGLVLLAQGEPTAALGEMEREADTKVRQVGLPLVLDRLGRNSEADAALAMAEEKSGNQWAYQIALVYAARNDADRAFAWLERAFIQHDGGLTWVKDDPLLKNIENDPRYKAFLRKMKLQT